MRVTCASQMPSRRAQPPHCRLDKGSLVLTESWLLPGFPHLILYLMALLICLINTKCRVCLHLGEECVGEAGFQGPGLAAPLLVLSVLLLLLMVDLQ